jgi:hypothetical protein
MIIPPVGAKLFHAGRQTDGQTDITKLIVISRFYKGASKFENNAEVDENKCVFLHITVIIYSLSTKYSKTLMCKVLEEVK